MNNNFIAFRIIEFHRKNEFQLICCETDIAVTAETELDAINKMSDALCSYLCTFSEKEIKQRKYLRLLPPKVLLRYIIAISIGRFVNKLFTVCNFFEGHIFLMDIFYL